MAQRMRRTPGPGRRSFPRAGPAHPHSEEKSGTVAPQAPPPRRPQPSGPDRIHVSGGPDLRTYYCQDKLLIFGPPIQDKAVGNMPAASHPLEVRGPDLTLNTLLIGYRSVDFQGHTTTWMQRASVQLNPARHTLW